MGETATIWLPFPRVAEARLRRVAAPERLAFADDLPLEVPDLAGTEAPVALVLGGGHGPERAFRESGGRLLRPFLAEAGTTPGEAAEILGRRAGDLRGAGLAITEHLFHPHLLYRGVNRSRGLLAGDDPRVAEVADDGRAAQEADRARAQAGLALVDGRLHHACPPPCVAVLAAPGKAVLAKAQDWYANWPAEIPYSEPSPPWMRFPAGRAAEAEAFAGDLARLLGLGLEPPRTGTCTIADAEAYARAGCERPWEETLRDSADAAMALLADIAGHCDDATLAGFVALRAAAPGARDPEEVVALAARAVAQVPGRACAASVHLRALVLRADEYRPADEMDEVAMAGMRP